MAARIKATRVQLYSGAQVTVYASPRVQEALSEITDDMTLYKGVRLAQLLEAVYRQGAKDGAAEAFRAVDRGLAQSKQIVPHRNPGRPRKRS